MALLTIHLATKQSQRLLADIAAEKIDHVVCYKFECAGRARRTTLELRCPVRLVYTRLR